MSNYLKVETREAIKHLLKTGHSQRWIARELGVHRSTVKRYAKELSGSKCTISRTGKVGRPSHCEAYRQQIESTAVYSFTTNTLPGKNGARL